MRAFWSAVSRSRSEASAFYELGVGEVLRGVEGSMEEAQLEEERAGLLGRGEGVDGGWLSDMAAVVLFEVWCFWCV